MRASLSGITANGNDLHGIDLEGSGNKLTRNAANGNGLHGINLEAEVPSSGNRLSGNETNGNGDSGIRVQVGNTGNRLSGNSAQSNTGFDLEDENPGCADNAWSKNTFGSANDPCIE
jgi:parallel beta-helix repeat protein